MGQVLVEASRVVGIPSNLPRISGVDSGQERLSRRSSVCPGEGSGVGTPRKERCVKICRKNVKTPVEDEGRRRCIASVHLGPLSKFLGTEGTFFSFSFSPLPFQASPSSSTESNHKVASREKERREVGDERNSIGKQSSGQG